MAFVFPESPSVGDTYQGYTWNGEAWKLPSFDSRVQALEDKVADIRNFTAPTGADGEPADYNVVVVDKATGQIRSIDPPDVVEVE